MRGNPVFKKKFHPSLFGEDTPIHVRLEDMTEDGRTNALADLTRADFGKKEWEELDDEWKEAILANDEDEREKRIEAFVAYFRERAAGQNEYEFESADGQASAMEGWFEPQMGDTAETAVEYNVDVHDLIKEYVEQGSDEDAVRNAVQEILSEDTEAWEFGGAVEAPGHRGHDWYYEPDNDAEDQVDGTEYHKDLGKLVDSFYWDDDLIEAIERVNRDVGTLDFTRRKNWEDDPRKELERSFGFRVGYTGAWWADVNIDHLRERMEEKFGEGKVVAAPRGPDVDKIVYRFKDGAYVADLPKTALKNEGRELGICVGDPRYQYGKSVEAGRTKVFSLRTPAGRSKFTFEFDVRGKAFRQVKGKANRLPGFEPGKSGEGRVKADEVQKVTEFIKFMGVDPATVGDLAPALTALEGKRANPRGRKSPKHHCGFCRRA